MYIAIDRLNWTKNFCKSDYDSFGYAKKQLLNILFSLFQYFNDFKKYLQYYAFKLTGL